ncbi:TolC family protein [Bacteroides sp. 519]|uniref:TolC family protein n=1 Tax=Bacteroides sp. 519 TaxID=2302937 RepID=UPI0013D15C67|nr:TolC family protein [Bacteroides sp. 519]NDV59455.1 TolC family protein [Bacteroides sp. 519]
MKHRILLLAVTITLFTTGYAQLSIEDCYTKAASNYPLIKQYGLIEKSEGYNLSNISKGYLPQIQVSVKATYQSQVTKIPVDMPGIEALKKDQYSAAIDLNQSIWDGGNMKAQKENIRTQAEVNRKHLDVTLYAIRERVNQLFFGILLFDEMLKQNALYQEELKRNFTQTSAYMRNGLANQADLDAIQVEQIKATQHETELFHTRTAYAEILSAFIGERMNECTLIKPKISDSYKLTNYRPELLLYDAQLRNVDAQRKEINAALMPRFNLFATGGYGRPGLNMLESKFSAYYIVGVAVNWNFSNLYTRKNKLKTIEVNKGMIEAQHETFLFNNNLDITQSNNEIRKISELLSSDNDIIRLRGSVKRSAQIKVDNGTLSVLDLMKEVNAEQQAIQNKIIHEIEFLQAVYNLKYITNN